ncbi:unknown [Parabacteroides johnsonii CAG:246]|nr:unknown [Parabacteroides johnsonii CAG:246]
MSSIGRLECGPLPMPIRIRSAIAHQSEEVMMFRRKTGTPPATLKRTLCKNDPGVYAEQLFSLGSSLPASV